MSDAMSAARDMSSFFWLCPPLGRAYSISGLGEHSLTDIDRYARGLEVPSRPVVLRWRRGRKQPADAIWLGVSNLAISPRLIDLLTPFTGWSTYPVEVYDGWGARAPGYVGLVIVGRCGRMLHDLERVEQETDWNWLNYVGLHFSLESWDGSDIFYPSLGAGPIVSLRLRDALRRARVTNILLEQLSEARTEKRMVDDMRVKHVGPYADVDPPAHR